MATNIKFCKKWDYNDIYEFRTYKGECFWVKSFENGIATVDPSPGDDIYDFASMIAGCFKLTSNVEAELQKAFNTKQKLKGIKFEFNKNTVFVTKENADTKKIVSKWREQMETF